MSRLQRLISFVIVMAVVLLFQNCSDDFDLSVYETNLDSTGNPGGSSSLGGEPIGVLDAVTAGGLVSGWACDSAAPNAIVTVNIRAGDAPETATLVAAVTANEDSEQAVLNACKGGIVHRFTYQLTAAQLTTFAGKSVYVEALSFPEGAVKATILNGDGKYKVPTSAPPPPPQDPTQGRWSNTASSSNNTLGSCTVGPPPQNPCTVGSTTTFIPFCPPPQNGVFYGVTILYFTCVK